MAYEKYTWVDGELITAEKLNHMEDGIAEGGGEAGYECTETTEQLFNETVTTEESDGEYLTRLNYAEPIEVDELTVVFNGTEYVCPKAMGMGVVQYGGFDATGEPDFTNYPFAIVSLVSLGGGNVVMTESSITATITASAVSTTVETTECFEKAVKTVADRGYECGETRTPLFDETVTTVQDGDDVSAQLAYSGQITADKLHVIFNGTQYICPKIIVGGINTVVYYGGMSETGDPDFTNYPFLIASSLRGNLIGTETANTYHIEVAAVVTEVTDISPCLAACIDSVAQATFNRAIQSAGIPDIREGTVEERNIDITNGTVQVTIDVSDHYRAEKIIGIIGIESLEKFRGDGKQIVVETFGVNGTEISVELRSRTGENTLLDILRIQFTYIYKDNGGTN